MFSQILSLFVASIGATVSWFEDILTKSGGVSFYLVIIFIVLVFRYLLAPVLGDNKNKKSRDVGDD